MSINLTESIKSFVDYLIHEEKIKVIAGVASVNLSGIELSFDPSVIVPYVMAKVKCQNVLIINELPPEHLPGKTIRRFEGTNYSSSDKMDRISSNR